MAVVEMAGAPAFFDYSGVKLNGTYLSLIPRQPRYVARMERSAIRESAPWLSIFPAFRCAACGLRVAHFMAQAPYSRAKALK